MTMLSYSYWILGALGVFCLICSLFLAGRGVLLAILTGAAIWFIPFCLLFFVFDNVILLGLKDGRDYAPEALLLWIVCAPLFPILLLLLRKWKSNKEMGD